jgi:hypothetical protein
LAPWDIRIDVILDGDKFEQGKCLTGRKKATSSSLKLGTKSEWKAWNWGIDIRVNYGNEN